VDEPASSRTGGVMWSAVVVVGVSAAGDSMSELSRGDDSRFSTDADRRRTGLPNNTNTRPSCCTRPVLSTVGEPSSTVDRTRHVDARCCQHRLYRTRRRSVCRGEIFQVHSLRQSFRGKYLLFLRYTNFPKTQRSIIGRGKPVCKKSARSVQPFRYNTSM